MGYGSGSHQWAADLCLVGRDEGWELRILYVSQVYSVTIHDKVPSLSSGVRAFATY